MISADRMGCSAARNRGTCNNRKTLKRVDLEERVLNGLRQRLMTPEMIATFVETYQEESRKDQRDAKGRRMKAEQDLRAATREIDNIVDAIAQGMFQPSMKAKMDTLEARKAELEALLDHGSRVGDLSATLGHRVSVDATTEVANWNLGALLQASYASLSLAE